MGVSAKLRMRSTGFSWESKSKVRPKKKKNTPVSARKAVGYPRKAQENKRSHTDSISPSLSAEGAMHE